jgi:predicted nucleic-acid-binding protein
VIGLDTNILVRFITQDDPVQAARATALIEWELTADTPGFVNLVTLAEVAWVLRNAYGYSREDVVDEFERLLRIEQLVVASRADVLVALTLAEDGLGDFADALIGQLNVAAGCVRTVTFDRRARRLPGFEML